MQVNTKLRHFSQPSKDTMSLFLKFLFHRFSDEVTADENDVKFKQWNGRERSLYFEPRYDFDNFGH